MLPSRIDKNALWKEHADRFSCEHARSELRERTVKGGGKQYVQQCLRCGSAISSPVKKENALAENGGKPLPPFDEQLVLSWEAAAKESAEKIKNADESAFWLAYEEYLAGPAWRRKREKVFERAGGVCEGCREQQATQVHHLSYEHVGGEFIFELVAVCDDCHEKLHNQQ
jgi:hypothetical protein